MDSRGGYPWRVLRRAVGLVRSLVIYARPGRQRSLRRLYAPFVYPGALVFDIGAHIGDRTRAFAALGARVVAFEPQPQVQGLLRFFTRGLPAVTLRREAVGRSPGRLPLAISLDAPTVSTLSGEWRDAVRENNPGFSRVRWQEALEVEVVTLEQMIALYGLPDFCKIDVEGFEAEVLRGLDQPIPALSFEFVLGSLDYALQAMQELQRLGRYQFNVIEGEKRRFLFSEWHDAEALMAWLQAGADAVVSGDIYARLVSVSADQQGQSAK
jgi:FkbM family methyltransferase